MATRPYRGSATQLENIPHPDLVALIKAFCAITGRGATGVCRDATGDDKLLWDLQGGRRIGVKMRNALIEYMQTQMLEIDDKLNELEALILAATPAVSPPRAASDPSAE